MRSLILALGLAVPVILSQASFAMPQQMSYSETKKTIDKIDDRSHKFKENFDHDIKRSGLDSSTRHEMRRTVAAFEESARRLRKNYHKDNAAVTSVNDVLNQASVIDGFMASHPVIPRLQGEWLLLRQDLDLLAASYGTVTNWPPVLARTEWNAGGVAVPGRLSSEQMLSLISNIQISADSFDTNVTTALASSNLADTGVANSIHQYIADFEVSAGRLRDDYEADSLNVNAINDLLRRGEPIDAVMRTQPLTVAAQESWIQLKKDLIRLSAGYNLSPAWLSEK